MTIYNEVKAEREKQKQQWKHDGYKPLAEWSALICHYASKQAIGEISFVNEEEFRQSMVKVAALAIAAIEAMDEGDQ